MVSYWSTLRECIESPCVTGVDSATWIFLFAHAGILCISHDSLAAGTYGLLADSLESLVANWPCTSSGGQFGQLSVLDVDFPVVGFAMTCASLVHRDVRWMDCI